MADKKDQRKRLVKLLARAERRVKDSTNELLWLIGRGPKPSRAVLRRLRTRTKQKVVHVCDDYCILVTY